MLLIPAAQIYKVRLIEMLITILRIGLDARILALVVGFMAGVI